MHHVCGDPKTFFFFFVNFMCLHQIAKAYTQCKWWHVFELITICKVLIRIIGTWQCFAPPRLTCDQDKIGAHAPASQDAVTNCNIGVSV